jgi:hypothetical protein
VLALIAPVEDLDIWNVHGQPFVHYLVGSTDQTVAKWLFDHPRITRDIAPQSDPSFNDTV